jgi:hypothetical protein
MVNSNASTVTHISLTHGGGLLVHFLFFFNVIDLIFLLI